MTPPPAPELVDEPTCDYCRSPLPFRRWAGGAVERSPDYCCVGCRLAATIVAERGEAGAAQALLTRLGLSIFFTMLVVAFTMALWTTDVYEAARPSDRPLLAFQGMLRHLSLLLSLPVLILLGFPLFGAAWAGLRRGSLSTDVLLGLGVAASFAISGLAVFRGAGGVYFEVGCVILVMTTLGRWLEATGRLKATSALEALARLLPTNVRRVDPESGLEELVPLEELRRGDRIRILPGERVPADGQVLRGAALVDEQVLTGESRPVLREPGSPLLGGTLDLDGELLVLATAVGREGTLARVVELVRRAGLSKGRYQKLVDRASSWFFPAVATVALASFAYHSASRSVEEGVLAALAVGLIACPCALGLATPLAVWSALGQAAGHQVLFQGGEALERLADARAVRFDKTGTLTTGTASVHEVLLEGADATRLLDVLAVSAALAGRAPHALSRAVVERAEAEGVVAVEVERARVVPGRGVVAVEEHTGRAVALGSPRLMGELGMEIGPGHWASIEAASEAGLPVALAGWDGGARALFVFRETWRAGATEVMAVLRGMELDVAILTGDQAARGLAIADRLGVVVEAGLLPEDKVEAVERARREHGCVVMVGDGVNDAPALAASDVGVALGCGTDVSRESAGVCLLGDDLTRIPWAIGLARRTVHVVRTNLIWAFGYNTVGVALAAVGWLNPAVAAGLMVASGLFVIANSLQLRAPEATSESAGAPASNSALQGAAAAEAVGA